MLVIKVVENAIFLESILKCLMLFQRVLEQGQLTRVEVEHVRNILEHGSLVREILEQVMAEGHGGEEGSRIHEHGREDKHKQKKNKTKNTYRTNAKVSRSITTGRKKHSINETFTHKTSM